VGPHLLATHCGLDTADKSNQQKWRTRHAARPALEASLQRALRTCAAWVARRACTCHGKHAVCRADLVALLGPHGVDVGRFKVNCLFFRPQVCECD
jgi:hypothetical protein